MGDLIKRMDAIQACQVGPSDEWSKATKSGYEQAATDCAMNILRIAPAALDAAEARDGVKPLVWEQCNDTDSDYFGSWSSLSVGVYYRISEVFGQKWEVMAGMPNGLAYSNLDAAKAAAQADYEARILSALAPFARKAGV